MEKCEVLKNKLKTKIKDIPSMFVESSCKPEVSRWSVISMEILKSSCGGELCRHEFQDENTSMMYLMVIKPMLVAPATNLSENINFGLKLILSLRQVL